MSDSHELRPSLRTSDAYGLGVSRGRLAGPDWEAPLRGVVRPSGGSASSRQRVSDVAELVPAGGAVGGWAAALLLGATDLDGRGASGSQVQPVPVVLPPPLLIRPRRELVRWRSELTPDDLVVVEGIPCTSPLRTAFDLARFSPLRPGVVALDVLGRQLGIRPSAVCAYARRHPRWRGKPRVLEAVALADPRARSVGETRLRLVWVLDAQLPTPQVNPRICSGDGFLLGIGDLLEIEVGMLGEYDGAGHREPGQHALDNAREEAFEDAGLVVVRAGAVDLSPQSLRRTVHRLLAGHRRASSRDRSHDTWTWQPESLLD